jgi:hypothetical protein
MRRPVDVNEHRIRSNVGNDVGEKHRCERSSSSWPLDDRDLDVRGLVTADTVFCDQPLLTSCP